MQRIVLFILLLLPFTLSAAEDLQYVMASREAINDFSKQLKGTLQQSLASGGPIEAIKVCHNVAIDITDKISRQYGWKIGRTSLKVRNPDNAPDNWERQTLIKFEERRAKGENITAMEFHEIIQSNGKPVFRYMKAIPTGSVCLACHGDEFSTALDNTLQSLYPNDQARGFKTGDIRGAFTVIHSLNKAGL